MDEPKYTEDEVATMLDSACSEQKERISGAVLCSWHKRMRYLARYRQPGADEPKYTLAQVTDAVSVVMREHSPIDRVPIIEIAERIISKLDPPVQTCRCGKWRWNVPAVEWRHNDDFFRGAGLRDSYTICSGCRCALLEDGKITLPLSTWDECELSSKQGVTSREPFHAWLRDQPISAAPDRTES